MSFSSWRQPCWGGKRLNLLTPGVSAGERVASGVGRFCPVRLTPLSWASPSQPLPPLPPPPPLIRKLKMLSAAFSHLVEIRVPVNKLSLFWRVLRREGSYWTAGNRVDTPLHGRRGLARQCFPWRSRNDCSLKPIHEGRRDDGVLLETRDDSLRCDPLDLRQTHFATN